MERCHSCAGCGSCDGCSGCAKALYLTEEELALLRLFAQIPFLPVARNASDTVPVFLEKTDCPPELRSPVLQCLEKKGLIDIDYHLPLSGFDYTPYHAYPLHGSMALTARGQAVLDTLELQGIE